MIGKSLVELIPGFEETNRYQAYRKVLKTGKPCHFEDVVPHPMFGELHLDLKVFKVGDGLGFIFSDVTEQRHTEKALRENEERYRSVIENATEAITMINEHGEFLVMNQAAARQLGGQPEDYIGKTLRDILLPKKFVDEKISNIKKIIKSGEGRITEFQVPIYDEIRWFVSSTQPVRDSSGRITAVVNLSTNITEWKRGKQELENSRKQLRQLARHLQEVRETESMSAPHLLRLWHII